MMDQGRRKHPRVKARLKVRFKNTSSFISEYTHNISKGGIFIRTKKPCELGDEVEVILVMPESGEEISAFGEVAHRTLPEEADTANPAGMGVQITHLDSQDQDRIEQFINEHFATPEKDLSKGRREHKRYRAKIKVRFISREALIDEYVRNISYGGIFIQTERLKQVGEKLRVILVHPDSGEEIAIEGEVVRVITPEDAAQSAKLQPGMGIKFLEMDEQTTRKLEGFMNSKHVQKNDSAEQ